MLDHNAPFSRMLHLGLKPRYRFFTLMGLLPPFNFEERKLIASKYYKIFVLILVFVISVYNFVAILIRNSFLMGKELYTSFVITIVNNILTWLQAVHFTGLSVFRGERFEELFNAIADVESLTTSAAITSSEKKKSRIELVFFILLNVMVLLYGSMYNYWIFEAFAIVANPIINFLDSHIIFVYYLTMILYIMILLLTSCKSKYIELNMIIKSLKYSKVYEEVTLSMHIKQIERVFKKISKIVRLLNDLIGIQFFLMIGACSSLLLENCLYFKHVFPTNENLIAYPATRAIVGLINFVATSAVLLLCDQIINESKKTMTTCYDLQDCISIYSKPYQELQEFTNKIPEIKVKFSAGGFFDIDRSIIFSVVGSVATYFIVAEQFWEGTNFVEAGYLCVNNTTEVLNGSYPVT